jgi:hypothetical protein
MKHHAQAGRVQGNAGKQIAGAAERDEGVDQPNEVARQRETQPKQRHRSYKYSNLMSLPQVVIPKLNLFRSTGAIFAKAAHKANKGGHLGG